MHVEINYVGPGSGGGHNVSVMHKIPHIWLGFPLFQEFVSSQAY